jgi:hypothetical protein
MSELYTHHPPEVVARNRMAALDTTAATTLLTFTPPVSGLYQVGVAGTVQTAATDLTVSITYTDSVTQAAATLTLADAVSEPVGPVSLSGFIAAQAGAAVTVTATAGTANQVTLHPVVTALP